MGHLSEPDYLAQRRHLEELRAEVSGVARESVLPAKIQGVGQSWRLADESERRRLLGVFFDKL
jgi:hypothetical protein